VLLILGPKRLPDAGRALGHGIIEFKGSLVTFIPRTQEMATSERHRGGSRAVIDITDAAVFDGGNVAGKPVGTLTAHSTSVPPR
jgi:hypothetical protein